MSKKRGSFKKNAHGQMKMSFGMIFSIILIIVFLAFAFYAIKKFLDFQNSVKILQFNEDLQEDVDEMWKSSQGSYEAEYSLPPKVSSVCFVDKIDKGNYNLIFNSNSYIEEKKIDHIDLEKTLDREDSVCFDVVNGKVRMIIKKDYNDALITISQIS